MAQKCCKKVFTVEELSKKFIDEKKKVCATAGSVIKTGDAMYKEVERWKKMHDKVEREKKALEEENKQIKCKIDEQGDQPMLILSSSKSHVQIKNDYETLKRRFSQMDTKNTKLRARNTLLEREKDEVKVELEAIKSDLTNLNIEVTKLKGLNSSLRSQCNKLKAGNTEDLKRQLESTKVELDTFILENSHLKNEIDEIKAQQAAAQDNNDEEMLEKARSEVDSLKAEVANLKKNIIELDSKNITLKKQSENIISENDRTLQTMEKFDEEMDRCKHQLQLKEEDYRTLQMELDSVLKTSQIGSHCASELQKENGNLKHTIFQMQNILEVTQKDLEKALARAINTSKYQVDNEQLVGQLAEQYEEILKLKDDIFTNALIKDENIQLRNQLSTINGEMDRLRQRAQQLEMYQNQLEIIKDNESKYRQRINFLECENTKLINELNSLKDEMMKIPQINDDKQKKITSRIYTLEQEIDGLRKELNGSLDQIKYKSNELTKVQCSDANNKQKIIDLHQEMKTLKSDLQAISEKEEKASKLLKELKNKDGAVKSKLSQLEAEKSKLKKQLDESMAGVKEKSEGLEDLFKKYQQLQVQNEVLIQQLDALPKGNMEYLRNTVYNLQKEKTNLEGAYQAINKEYEKLKSIQSQEDCNIRQTIGQLELENENLRNKMEELLSSGDNRSELIGIRKDFNKIKENMSRLEDENEALKEEKSRMQHRKASESNMLFRKRVAQLEDENVKLKLELDKIYRELRNASHVIEESSKLKKRVHILESEIDSQRKSYEAALAQSREMVELSGILKEKVRAMECENAQLKKTKGKLDQKASNEYKEKIKKLEKQLDGMGKQMEEAHKKCKVGDNVMQENKKLRIRVRDMEVDLELLRRELDGAITDMRTSEQNNEVMSCRCADLKSKVAALETQREKLKKKCSVKFLEDTFSERNSK